MSTPHRVHEHADPPPRRHRRLRAEALLLGTLACPTESGAVATAAAELPHAVVTPAGEGGAPAVKIAGEYGYAGGEAQRQQLLEAIEEVVAELSFIVRPIARKRLREGSLPSAELRLVVTDDEITIGRPGRITVSAPRDGSAIAWKSPDGDEFQVRHRLVGDGRLVQEFVGEDNRSENVFALADGGARVDVHTTIAADRLPKALRFRMTYRRKSAED